MNEFAPLPRRFYEPSAETVAEKLLGHYLVRMSSHEPCGGIIVETEAYLHGDPACHGAPGPTQRNRVMFGPPGHAYVYLIYGFHFCVNAVCQPAGMAEAVLIRAIEPTFGRGLMAERRGRSAMGALTSGPGKLCKALEITRALDGADLCSAESPLFIARNPSAPQLRRRRGPVTRSPRIGITKAATLPLRFYLAGSEFVSRIKRKAKGR